MISTARMSWRSVLTFCLLLQTTKALHHSFYTKHDHRRLVGPIGVPFGFLKQGYYNLEVYDFKLEINSKKYKAIKGQESLSDNEVLDTLEAGFLLQRFPNEAAFNQHMDELRSNSSVCAFESFLEEDDSYLSSLPGFDEAEEGEGEVNADHGVFLSMKDWRSGSANVGSERAVATTEYTFMDDEEGLYFLVFQICPSLANGNKGVPHGIVSTYELDYHLINVDSSNRQSYLTGTYIPDALCWHTMQQTHRKEIVPKCSSPFHCHNKQNLQFAPAGEMNLPMVFFYFAVSYAFCCGWWISNIKKNQNDTSPGKPAVYAIHHLMSALILIKTITVLLESIRYHYLRVVGHAELWSFVYYTFAFLKGTFLFVVILLIGSGWSIVKPFLNGSEKKVILAVLVLQVINNIALTVLAHETEGESSFAGWTAILHLVDIICCCAVLVPIVWQVNQLEKSVIVDDPDHPDFNGESEKTADTLEQPENGNMADMGEKGRILEKLKLFRTFYMLVVAYIYSTRILVYLFATMLNYKHLWIRYFVVEVVTLTFYVVTGYYFRPTVDGPYQGVKKEEEGDDDNFIDERELEMGTF